MVARGLGGTELRAVATFTAPGETRQREVRNGLKGGGRLGGLMAEDCLKMVERLRAESEYDFQLQALPQSFARNPDVSLETKQGSLMYHCEKKALACQLARGVAAPQVSVNIRMCADCRLAFECAARLWRCTILCDETQSKQRNVFRP